MIIAQAHQLCSLKELISGWQGGGNWYALACNTCSAANGSLVLDGQLPRFVQIQPCKMNMPKQAEVAFSLQLRWFDGVHDAHPHCHIVNVYGSVFGDSSIYCAYRYAGVCHIDVARAMCRLLHPGPCNVEKKANATQRH